MVQSQFESSGLPEPTTPNLTNNDLAKQMLAETGLAFGVGVAGGTKAAPNAWATRAAQQLKSGKIEMASSLRITEPIAPRVLAEHSSPDSSVSASSATDLCGFSNTDAAILPVSETSKPVKQKKSFDGLNGLNAALRESRSGKEAQLDVETAPEPAQVVKKDGGIKPMKTADTAGDGIVATAPRPSSSAMVKDFAPPNGASGPEPIRIADASPKAESSSKVVASKSQGSLAVVESLSSAKKEIALEVQKPVEMSPELAALAKKMDTAFFDAQRHSKAFEFQRTQRQSERDINDIESGRRKFASIADKERALSNCIERKTCADQSLREGVPPRYAQTLKKLVDYTKAVEAYYQTEPNSVARDAVMKEAVAKVEELMSPIDNIWNGIPGKTPDLARPGARSHGERPIWPEERIQQIQEHLDAKINTVDNAQAQRIGVVRDNVAFKELLKQHEAGELPKGGSVVFFTSEGTLLYQSELKVSQRSTQARAKDHASAEKHANNTPAFIDVAKIDRGLGPEGAGLWRFIGQENRIVGAAILQPVIKDGKLVELPGAKNRNGEPTIKKEVFRTIGEVPAEVTVNMAYGHLLNMLRSRKITAERAAAPIDGSKAEVLCTPEGT